MTDNRPTPPDDRMARMLLWFENQLPEHELGYWRFEEHPNPSCLLNEGTRSDWSMYYSEQSSASMLRGWAACVRCNKSFELERWGNFSLYPKSEDERLAVEFPTLTRAAKIGSAKDWLRKQALRDGKCWGNVPKVPSRAHYAVSDGLERQ